MAKRYPKKTIELKDALVEMNICKGCSYEHCIPVCPIGKETPLCKRIRGVD